jgi:hypothetical protein
MRGAVGERSHVLLAEDRALEVDLDLGGPGSQLSHDR